MAGLRFEFKQGKHKALWAAIHKRLIKGVGPYDSIEEARDALERIKRDIFENREIYGYNLENAPRDWCFACDVAHQILERYNSDFESMKPSQKCIYCPLEGWGASTCFASHDFGTGNSGLQYKMLYNMMLGKEVVATWYADRIKDLSVREIIGKDWTLGDVIHEAPHITVAAEEIVPTRYHRSDTIEITKDFVSLIGYSGGVITDGSVWLEETDCGATINQNSMTIMLGTQLKTGDTVIADYYVSDNSVNIEFSEYGKFKKETILTAQYKSKGILLDQATDVSVFFGISEVPCTRTGTTVLFNDFILYKNESIRVIYHTNIYEDTIKCTLIKDAAEIIETLYSSDFIFEYPEEIEGVTFSISRQDSLWTVQGEELDDFIESVGYSGVYTVQSTSDFFTVDASEGISTLSSMVPDVTGREVSDTIVVSTWNAHLVQASGRLADLNYRVQKNNSSIINGSLDSNKSFFSTIGFNKGDTLSLWCNAEANGNYTYPIVWDVLDGSKIAPVSGSDVGKARTSMLVIEDWFDVHRFNIREELATQWMKVSVNGAEVTFSIDSDTETVSLSAGCNPGDTVNFLYRVPDNYNVEFNPAFSYDGGAYSKETLHFVSDYDTLIGISFRGINEEDQYAPPKVTIGAHTVDCSIIGSMWKFSSPASYDQDILIEYFPIGIIEEASLPCTISNCVETVECTYSSSLCPDFDVPEIWPHFSQVGLVGD